jgi:hypothetical protein
MYENSKTKLVEFVPRQQEEGEEVVMEVKEGVNWKAVYCKPIVKHANKNENESKI